MAPGRVLVVDDEADVRSVCRRGLSQLGFEVVEAASGAEALSLARKLSFDMLLLDFRMPGMDGLETFRAVKALQPDVLGVMMTAYAAVDNAVQAVNLGFSGFVLKPFRLQDLQAAVQDALAKREHERDQVRAATLASLARLSKAMAGMDLDDIVHNVVQVAMRETRSDAASVLLFANGKAGPNGDGQPLRVSAGRPLDVHPVVLETLSECDGLRVVQADPTSQLAVHTALCGAGLGSLAVIRLAAPRQAALGVLWVARDVQAPPYSSADLEALTLLASQTAIVVSNARLYSQVVESERLNQSLQRYLSPRTVQAIKDGQASPGPLGEAQIMTVLLADMVDFSRLVEHAELERVIEVMHEYFSAAVEIISAHQGVVDELTGDEILASFDRSTGRADDALRAVKAGLQMLERLDQLHVEWKARGLPSFDIGIGISTGLVTLGSIGSGERKALVTAGRILNLAARSQALTRQTGLRLIITQGTFDEVRDLIQYRELGAVRLKGIEGPVGLYGVYGLKQ